MKPIPVAVINASKIVTDSQLAQVVRALQRQVSEHLAPRWNVDAALEIVPSGQAPPAESWLLIIDDDTDIPPLSGYHNVAPAGFPPAGTSAGIPYGKAFVNTSMGYKENWTITASHELLEMLVNPYAVFASYVAINDRSASFYELEICDPVSPDACAYEIDGVSVSDFVFPEWFSPFLAQPDIDRPAKQVDQNKQLAGPAPAIVADTTVSVSSFRWQDFKSEASTAQQARGKTRR
jgi:hypothetical protein